MNGRELPVVDPPVAPDDAAVVLEASGAVVEVLQGAVVADGGLVVDVLVVDVLVVDVVVVDALVVDVLLGVVLVVDALVAHGTAVDVDVVGVDVDVVDVDVVDVDVDVVDVDAAATVIVIDDVSTVPALLDASTTNVLDPAVVGVPDNTPPDDNMRPAGSVPLPDLTANVGVGVPDAVNV